MHRSDETNFRGLTNAPDQRINTDPQQRRCVPLLRVGYARRLSVKER